MNDDFQEIGHCGGQFIVTVSSDEQGKRSFQIGMHHSRPTPASFFGVFALPQGIPISPMQIGGWGDPSPSPPISGCFPVFIASDHHGNFGHLCKRCKGYWRSGGAPATWPLTCPYCGMRAWCHEFLTEGQMKYVQACCKLIQDALASEKDGKYVINMDEIADAAGKDIEKPKLFYAEESQQNKYTCKSCGEYNDILGTYGYCSSCGTRNDFQMFEEKTIKAIQDRINNGGPFEGCVRDTVADFDSFGRQYAKQLTQCIPMTPVRKERFKKMLFHNLGKAVEELKTSFEIDLFTGLNPDERDFVKQALHETNASAQKLVTLVIKMARNLHMGFHEIFPPEKMPISFQREKLKFSTTTKSKTQPATSNSF